MTIFQSEKAKALYELLSLKHAEMYTGTDDRMADDCVDWIGGLTDEEVAEIAVSVFREGL